MFTKGVAALSARAVAVASGEARSKAAARWRGVMLRPQCKHDTKGPIHRCAGVLGARPRRARPGSATRSRHGCPTARGSVADLEGVAGVVGEACPGPHVGGGRLAGLHAASEIEVGVLAQAL